MRPTNKRYPRTLRLTAGALAIAAPTSAALAAGPSLAQTTLQVKPISNRLHFGQKLTVTGLAPRANAGQRLALEFSAHRRPWRTVAYTKVRSDGAFGLRALLSTSGEVRVAAAPPLAPRAGSASAPGAPPGVASTAGVASAPPAPPAPAAAPPAPPAPAAAPGAATPTPIGASQPQPVAVAARLVTSAGTVNALSGQPVEVRGALVPRGGGRLVRLEGRARGGWRTLSSTRTRASGHFVIRFADRAGTPQAVRLRFAGDSRNAGATSIRRQLVPFQAAMASWYQDAGSTACGFHAGNGIANLALPCGTKVTLAYHGRTVIAVVDDRGPFVAGRQFDLNQTVATTLGFGGVDTVWSFVQPPPAAHHRAPSSKHRRLQWRCSRAASHTSTWTRSTCRSSSVGARSSGLKRWWSPAVGRGR